MKERDPLDDPVGKPSDRKEQKAGLLGRWIFSLSKIFKASEKMVTDTLLLQNEQEREVKFKQTVDRGNARKNIIFKIGLKTSKLELSEIYKKEIEEKVRKQEKEGKEISEEKKTLLLFLEDNLKRVPEEIKVYKVLDKMMEDKTNDKAVIDGMCKTFEAMMLDKSNSKLLENAANVLKKIVPDNQALLDKAYATLKKEEIMQQLEKARTQKEDIKKSVAVYNHFYVQNKSLNAERHEKLRKPLQERALVPVMVAEPPLKPQKQFSPFPVKETDHPIIWEQLCKALSARYETAKVALLQDKKGIGITITELNELGLERKYYLEMIEAPHRKGIEFLADPFSAGSEEQERYRQAALLMEIFIEQGKITGYKDLGTRSSSPLCAHAVYAFAKAIEQVDKQLEDDYKGQHVSSIATIFREDTKEQGAIEEPLLERTAVFAKGYMQEKRKALNLSSTPGTPKLL